MEVPIQERGSGRGLRTEPGKDYKISGLNEINGTVADVVTTLEAHNYREESSRVRDLFGGQFQQRFIDSRTLTDQRQICYWLKPRVELLLRELWRSALYDGSRVAGLLEQIEQYSPRTM